MKAKLIITLVIVTLLLAACAPPVGVYELSAPETPLDFHQGSISISSIAIDGFATAYWFFKLVDYETNVVCYGEFTNSISCVPLTGR